ncbi:hypothetical protein BpHYR1_044637 [Brachionus plicatilis]|uniref:Uncharacterized protein n=1 Tax=Brachionus plicatilis TaxID=10195 RepID=A0A3M7QXR1_BRAPC|nr:hypothetical protein BpHYR1_044637 [Brachionus plicatilis]
MCPKQRKCFLASKTSAIFIILVELSVEIEVTLCWILYSWKTFFKFEAILSLASNSGKYSENYSANIKEDETNKKGVFFFLKSTHNTKNLNMKD